MADLQNHISLRTAAPDDRALLRSIYGSTRTIELERTNWDDEQKGAFITHQFEAQDAHYKQVYPDTDYSVIIYDAQPAGRLYVERNLIPGTIRIVDITLLPDFRNKGIGRYLIQQLQDEAEQAGKTLSIHVERFNKALQLYEKIGFQLIKETHGVYYLMEWRPPGVASSVTEKDETEDASEK